MLEINVEDIYTLYLLIIARVIASRRMKSWAIYQDM